MTSRIQELHADALLAPVVMSFLVGLLVPFDHGKPVPRLNRHTVQHGGDRAYGTKANAVAAMRVRATLGDPAIWYEVNSIAGRDLMVVGSVTVALGSSFEAVGNVRESVRR